MIRIYWVGFRTIVRKEVNRIFRIWMQSILPSAITMSLYYVIFGNLIGRRIGVMDGFNYIQYIAPGLIMMSVITNSYSEVVGAVFGMRFQRNIDEVLVAPLPEWIVLLGFTTGGIIRGLIVAAVVTTITLFFTHLTVVNPWLTFSIIFLASALFSLAGFSNALFAKNFDQVTFVPTFVLTPLTYLGGVFYSVNMLPSIWRDVSYANPILYIVNGFRDGILGVSDTPISHALFITASIVVALFALNISLLKRGVGIRT
jgi:ABC-2 type transport system permease protein